MVLKHQPSFSESVSSRASIPMYVQTYRSTIEQLIKARLCRWDSSDPDRAPPPLPLNPSASSPVTRPNTGANVAAVAEAFVAKTRENLFSAPSSPNKSPEKSPERSPAKSGYHRRLQSAQGGAVKDLSSYLENVRNPERSLERPLERPLRASWDLDSRGSERSPTRSSTPTPLAKDVSKDVSCYRPHSRPPLKAILSESPQSPAMRALQATPPPPAPSSEPGDSALASLTNGSMPAVRTPRSNEDLSTQIKGLTEIATSLQKEMNALSRRSKDNAVDLTHLRTVTNSRDEDIRKSMRELVTNLSVKMIDSNDPNRTPKQHFKSPSSYLLDDKPHGSPRGFSLPRIPSPTSFAASIDRDLSGSPSLYGVDGAASIALLEKILREMSTKDGLEKLMASVSDLAAKEPKKTTDPAVSKQLEEITKLLRDSTQSMALVKHDGGNGGNGNKPPQLGWSPDTPSNLAVSCKPRNTTPLGVDNSRSSPAFEGRDSNGSPRGVDLVSEEVFKLLKRMKDSITEGGGLTAEIKALVRELRGEVLGMGREIGRKLDQAESTQKDAMEDEAQRPGREEIATIVGEGLSELKHHIDDVMREHRRQSAASAMSKPALDAQDVHAAVQNALREFPMPEPTVQGSGIEREEILEAVREAWETYKPEIELQNFGLERDEILECLKEGLQDYKTSNGSKDAPGATYEDVLDAVKEGLQDFKPPAPIETEPSITKEEIMVAVCECLETFDFPTAQESGSREPGMTREEVLDAVRDGLLAQPTVTKELDFNREDLFDAVKAGLEETSASRGGLDYEVVEKMQDLLRDMPRYFKDYSEANGGDTSQVLDALKDGLERLRANIETYVDRAADQTGKDEIIDAVRTGMNNLRIDLEGSLGERAANPNSTDLLDMMEKEFEHLRTTISSSMARGESPMTGREELLDAIRDGFDDVRRRSPTSSVLGDEETINTVKEELRHMRETLATMLTRSGGSLDREEIVESIRECFDKAQLNVGAKSGRAESVLSNTSELLDAFNDGLDGLKADVERIVNKPIDMTVNYEILDTLKDGLASLRADMDRLRAQQVVSDRGEVSRGGEVVVADPDAPKSLSRPDIENLEVMITQLKIKVDAMDGVPLGAASTRGADDGASKTDFHKLEDMMKDLQMAVAALADRDPAGSTGAASKDDVYAIETLLRNMQAKVEEIAAPDLESFAKSEHIDSVDAAIRGLKEAVDDLVVHQETDSVSKHDIILFEAMLKEVQAGVGELHKQSDEGTIKKVDVDALELLCTESKAAIVSVADKLDSVARQEEVADLHAMMKDFTGKVEEEAKLTAQAFESRKIEHGGIADRVEEVRNFLADVRDELKSKVEGSVSGVDSLTVSLNTIVEAISSADLSTNLKELKDTLDKEFARHFESFESTKGEAEQHRDVILGKHDDHKAAIIADLTSKIDGRFDELMTKYDDAQIAADERTRAFDERSGEHTESIAATKAVADDVRLLIDTLGATVTESCKSMGEDSRTVFTKVEDLDAKFDDILGQIKTEDHTAHQLTRAEISKMLVAVEGLQVHASEFHPKVMDAITEVLSIVGQHYEHSQKSKDEIVTSVNAIPGAIPMPALPAPASSTPLERKIPAGTYDDSHVHAKLDRLVTHAAEAAQTAAQLQSLAEIKNQGDVIAARLEALLQTRETTPAIDADSGKFREVEEASMALEKRVAQKDAVELEIVKLSEEKTSLTGSVEALRREEREMSSTKSRMQAELSSLETALQIRREEMERMEIRAEGLEKRVIEGVMNHSRSLLLSSKPSSLKSMNLKRMTSNASSHATVTTHTGSSADRGTESAVSNAVGMALRKRGQPPSANTTPKGSRRILSLSTLGGNKTGATTERSLVLAQGVPGSQKGTPTGMSLKRSHSVKSNFPVSRKSSWGGSKQIGLYADEDSGHSPASDDKENSVLEEDEEEERDGSSDGTRTERQSSYTGTHTGTEISSSGYTGTGSYISGTESYASGSVAGDTEDRRTSYAVSTVGTVGMMPLEEEPAEHADGNEEGEKGLQLYTGGNTDDGRQRGNRRSGAGQSKSGSTVGTDSGIGTDLPTAALEGQFLFGN